MNALRNIALFFASIIGYSLNYTSFDQLVQKSAYFHSALSFPTLPNRIAIIANNDENKKIEVIQQAKNTHPIIHESVVSLMKKFLSYKRSYGSSIEKILYSSMDINTFIDRLLIKRPLMFMTESDSYLLRNGIMGYGGFETIGTIREKSPLTLNNYLSYDEMPIAALIGVSVPTYFINNGNRFNKAQLGKKGTYEEKGVYTGLVGARFEKPGYMEWQHMIITPEQNTTKNGYGDKADKNNQKTKLLHVWSQLYETILPTFDEVKNDTSGKYISLGTNMYLNSEIYKKRMRLVIEPFLIDANEHGKKQNKKVYCHAVGLGLGVWQKSPQQAELILQVYADIIRERNISFIADIDFSWFPEQYKTCGGVGNLQTFTTPYNSITIHFSKRNPADPLTGLNAQKLLIAMYAWDGNTYPGNEYWNKLFTASGDPAAACCSTISELQNPLINPAVSSKTLFIIKK